ncbi:MAG: hypothetical protein KF874_04735 [Rhizobiaceae bacterium]|nr:hypothetical protein [Rhizobiaceae bacterium]
MSSNRKSILWTAAKLTLGAAMLAGATGAAFAAWLNHGDEIFLSVIESGLAWCM